MVCRLQSVIESLGVVSRKYVVFISEYFRKVLVFSSDIRNTAAAGVC